MVNESPGRAVPWYLELQYGKVLLAMFILVFVSGIPGMTMGFVVGSLVEAKPEETQVARLVRERAEREASWVSSVLAPALLMGLPLTLHVAAVVLSWRRQSGKFLGFPGRAWFALLWTTFFGSMVLVFAA